MKPSCTALVSVPTSAAFSPHARCRSSAAALALNQSEVPRNSATTMSATARRGIGRIDEAMRDEGRERGMRDEG